MKDIPGYEGLYAVTRDGRIWSYAKPYSSKTGMFMKPQLFINRKNRTTPHVQHTVGLSKNGKRKSYLIHRLVAKTYIPNPENKPDINHKDTNPLNNLVSNLEWCTKLENIQHAIKNGMIDYYTEKQKKIRSENGKTTGAINGMKSRRMFSMDEAECIRKTHAATKKSYRSIARVYNCSVNTVMNICNNKTYQAAA